jgi:hypothetical protein
MIMNNALTRLRMMSKFDGDVKSGKGGAQEFLAVEIHSLQEIGQ